MSTKETNNPDTSSELSHEIQNTRSGICNAFLITIAIIALPAVISSLYRITSIGWRDIMALHIVLALGIWIVTFYRNRINYSIRTAYVLMVLCIIALGGINQFGLLAGGTAFLVVAAPTATLLLGLKIGIITLISILSGAAIIGIYTVTGKLHYDFDIAAYAVAPASWATSFFSWSITSIGLVIAIHVFNNRLIKALEQSRLYAAALNENKLTLEKSIEQRQRTNLELKKALDEIRTLKGIIPICSYCHRIRDDDGAWEQMERYIMEHSHAQFSHGICPECINKARIDAGLEHTETES